MNIVSQIKERLNIVDIVSSYIKIEKAGSNFRARCPFHNEKTPSFFVSPVRNSYYCFGCNAKGDIFSFVENFEGLDFVGALKVLAERAGVQITYESGAEKSERDDLFSVLEYATIFFQNNLSGNKEALLYLKNRGLKIETVRDWRLGFAFDEWISLKDYLQKKGFSEMLMKKAGLIKEGESDGRFYDRFRGRIIFPIFDSSERVVGFSGRILKTNENTPKYLNSPDSELFDKSKILYGIHKAKQGIKKSDATILVEGQMDLLMSHQAGQTNTVAISGTALTTQHLLLLKRLSSKLILAFDADEAGFKATDRNAKLALSAGMELKIVDITGGKDPADIVLKNPDEWRLLVENSVHIIDYVLSKILSEKEKDKKKNLGIEIKNVIFPYLLALESLIEKSQFISKIAKDANIREDALWGELKKYSLNNNNDSNSDATHLNDNNNSDVTHSNRSQNNVETKILGIIFWQKDKDELLKNEIENRFIGIVGKEYYEELLKTNIQDGRVIFEAERMYENNNDFKRDLEELFFNLEEDFLKKKFEEVMNELMVAEQKKEKEKVESLLKKCQEMAKKIKNLKNNN